MYKKIFLSLGVLSIFLLVGCNDKDEFGKSKIEKRLDKKFNKKQEDSIKKDIVKRKKIKKESTSLIKKIDKEISKNKNSIDKDLHSQIKKQLKAEKSGKVNVLAGQRENMWE